MYAPPQTENNEGFVRLANLYSHHGVPVPRIHAHCNVEGYFLVQDFGAREFLSVYPLGSSDRAIELALEHLVQLQSIKSSEVPQYHRDRLFDEIEIFREWVCGELLSVDASPLDAVAMELVDRVDSQPKVLVHRDYHSRNLLLTPTGGLGIVDFQDSLIGPLAYDLASLLFDCYHQFSDEQIVRYLDRYRELSQEVDIPRFESADVLRRAVIDVAAQRQLKAIGIFVRLWLQREKTSHLRFVVPVTERVSDLAQAAGHRELSEWLAEDIVLRLRQRFSAVR